MGSVKDAALVRAEQGEVDAWLALKAIPDEAARQALAVIAKQAPEIALRTLALVAGSGVGKDGAKAGLEFRGALYCADREARTGERFGLHFYWTPEMGPIDSVIGIRDRLTKNIGAVEYRFRPLTAEEAALNDLQLTGDKADIAVAVEITVQRDRQAAVDAYRSDLLAYKTALEAAKLRADILGTPVNEADLPPVPEIRYHPVTGIGIVLGEERYEDVWDGQWESGKRRDGSTYQYFKKTKKKPPEQWGRPKPFDFVNYTWQEKAQTRALRAGFRRVPGALAEYEQRIPVGEGVALDLPDAKPVGRVQLLEAIEQEAARSAQVVTIEQAPDKAEVLAAMRAGAYGAEPEVPGAHSDAPWPERTAVDVQAVIARLRAEAERHVWKHPGQANAKQLASAWQGLAAIGSTEAAAKMLHDIFDHDGDLTAAECATVYFWLKPAILPDGVVTIDADAEQEAAALLAQYEVEELPFNEVTDEPTD